MVVMIRRLSIVFKHKKNSYNNNIIIIKNMSVIFVVSFEHSARKFDTGSVPSAFFSGAVISEFWTRGRNTEAKSGE